MKMKHEPTIQEFQQWILDTEAVFASSSRERKTLGAKIGGGYFVDVLGQKRREFMQPFAALECYNDITEKYVDETKGFIL